MHPPKIFPLYFFTILVSIYVSSVVFAAEDTPEKRVTRLVTDVDEELKLWSKKFPRTIAIGMKVGRSFPRDPEEMGMIITKTVNRLCDTAETIVMAELKDWPGVVLSLRYDGKAFRNLSVSELRKEIDVAANAVCVLNELSL